MSLAVEVEGKYVSVAELLNKQENETDLADVFAQVSLIKTELKRGNYSYLDVDHSSFAPAVGNPEKIICVGLNYGSHILETEKKVPDNPVLFSKYSNSLAGHLDNIKISNPDLKVDYEGELGIIIGKTARNVGDDFDKYVFGYFIGNDVSARELQYRTSQYLLGKTLDGFYPNGPSIVTKEEIPDPQNMWIKTKVNGEVRQDSNTKNMIFSIGKLISYISEYLTLKPGDIISTGTPEGVVMGMKDKEKHWLKPGDTVEVSIEGLGTLKNRFI
ncbi:MAG: fumarylacetoacetate hydrolase family protein [Candidatus Thermoplasmatota archaeon]|nr:fumarylacetoacetate hydrolase family protein [Candidatus Thermoplasmatota archaeon]